MPKQLPRIERGDFVAKGDPVTKDVTVNIKGKPAFVMEQRAFHDVEMTLHGACRECFWTDMQRSALGE